MSPNTVVDAHSRSHYLCSTLMSLVFKQRVGGGGISVWTCGQDKQGVKPPTLQFV